MPRPRKKREEKRTHRVMLRFTEDELAKIDEFASRLNIPRAVFIRKVALAKQVRPRMSRASGEFVLKLDGTIGELKKVGNNLNQLAKQANAGRFPAEGSILHVLEALSHTARKIEEAISRAK